MDDTNSTSTLPHTNMNKLTYLKNPWITLPILFAVFTIFMWFIDGNSANAQKEYSEEVKSIVAQIQMEQSTYSEAEKAEAAAKLALEKAGTDKFNASTRARGERFKLCTLHGLKADDKGNLVEAAASECLSFQ